MGNSSSQVDFGDSPVKLAAAVKSLNESPFFGKLSELDDSMEGLVLTPLKEEEYHAARRRVFNLDMRGYPLVITQPKNVEDISKCVNFVRDFGNNIKLCVCCGGHSNRCMVDGSFVIDMQLMKTVTLNNTDPSSPTVTVEGGAYLEEADKALEPHGLAIIAGTYPQTGIGGWTLAGGFGWLGRMYGMGVDHMVEVEVVLATGEVVVANDQNEHADLILGCRGGGGNFGIVSKFTFRAHKIPKYCHGGAKVFLCPTLSSAVSMCKNADTLYDKLPLNSSSMLVFPIGDVVVPTLWAVFDDEANTKAIPFLADASKLGGWVQVHDSVKPVSYHNELQRMTSKMIFSGFIYTSLVQVGACGEPLPEEFFAELLTHTRKSKPSCIKDAVVILFPMGGKIQSGTDLETMLSPSTRSAKYFGIIDVRWKAKAGHAGRDVARAWAKESARILSKYSRSQMRHAADCINENPVDQREEDLKSYDVGYHDSMLLRLQHIKARYDSSNLFSMNANIAPSSENAK